MLHHLGRFAPASVLVLVACTSARVPDGFGEAPPVGATASYQVAGPPACGAAIAEFQAVIDSDQRTGNVNASVYRRVNADLDGVKATCASGRSAEANNRLVAVKARYGYR